MLPPLVGGTDVGGTEVGGTVVGGTEDGGTDDGGTDDGGTEDGGTEDGGTDVARLDDLPGVVVLLCDALGPAEPVGPVGVGPVVGPASPVEVTPVLTPGVGVTVELRFIARLSSTSASTISPTMAAPTMIGIGAPRRPSGSSYRTGVVGPPG